MYSAEAEKPAFNPSDINKKLGTYTAVNQESSQEISGSLQLIDGKSFNHFTYEHLGYAGGKIK